MKFLVENWCAIVAIIAILAAAASFVYNFVKLPHKEQVAKVKEWLLWAVAQAEKKFGGKTGQLKLRYVYDLFTARFPFAAKFLTFEQFSNLVDEALEKFNRMLESNQKIVEYIGINQEVKG